MNNATYTPTPVNTEKIILPAAIIKLVDLLAKNTHDVWAAGRIAEGWTYGPERNDAKKETPCLKPYEELSESEKAYDMATATETLKLMLALGYRIEKSTLPLAPDGTVMSPVGSVLDPVELARRRELEKIASLKAKED